MQTKGNRKSGVTIKRGTRKTKKGGNKAQRQKNRGLGKSKKMKGRNRRHPRIYGGFLGFFEDPPAPAPATTVNKNEKPLATAEPQLATAEPQLATAETQQPLSM